MLYSIKYIRYSIPGTKINGGPLIDFTAIGICSGFGAIFNGLRGGIVVGNLYFSSCTSSVLSFWSSEWISISCGSISSSFCTISSLCWISSWASIKSSWSKINLYFLILRGH